MGKIGSDYVLRLYLFLRNTHAIRRINLDPFNDWGGGGCNNFVPVLGEDGKKISPTGDIFDQPSGE